ncbi:MAG: hypothetical protein EXR71_05255 [Myxococcales bacterium]|nr:hypothetical protein [Myxococcales bacterium]
MSDKPPDLADFVGKFFSRAQNEATRAARYGRELLSLRQLRTDRDLMFVKLGKEVRQLVDAGEVTHPGLVRGVARIAEFEEKIRLGEDALRTQGLDPDNNPSDGGSHSG